MSSGDEPKSAKKPPGVGQDPEATPLFPERDDYGAGPASESDTLVLPVGGVPDSDTGFDYDAFEASLDAISAEEERRTEARPRAVAPVDVRETLLRRSRNDDATYSVRPIGRYTLVTVQGRINESFDGESLGTQLRGADVIFDLTEVDRITSFGVRGWLRMMQAASLREAYFVRCSESVVNQITMIHNFCGPARVHSIIAPYLCGDCGAEFGVPLTAVEDSDLLRGRQPPVVRCPECQASTEMDEDPWAFFDLDEQLLTEVPEPFQRALDLMSDEPRHAPIEKAVSAGGTTRITFNGTLDERTRFRRAFGGIEGRVVIDLAHTESEAPGGHRKLLDAIRRAAEDVEFFRMEGVGPELGRMLVRESVPKLSVGSLRWMAHNDVGIRRRVTVDVPKNHVELVMGRPPQTAAAWAAGGITLEDAPLAAEVVRSVGAELALSATPAPAPRMQLEAAATPQPTPMPAPYVPGPSQTPYGTPYPMATQPPPPQLSYPPPQPQQGNTSRYILYGAAVLAVSSMLIAAVATTVVLVARTNNPTAAAPAPGAAAAPAPPPSNVEQWSTGGLAPPAWSGSPVMQTDSQLFIVGSGSGADPSEASTRARQAATAQFTRYVQAQIASSAASPGLQQFPLPPEPAELERLLQAHALPMMTEAQTASRQIQGRSEAILQFALDKSVVQPYVDTYTKTSSYQGLVVSSTPPWAARGVRLVVVPSWHTASVGAIVRTVDGDPTDDLRDFVQSANGSYSLLEPGEGFDIRVEGPDGPSTIRIGKKSAPKPRPELMR